METSSTEPQLGKTEMIKVKIGAKELRFSDFVELRQKETPKTPIIGENASSKLVEFIKFVHWDKHHVEIHGNSYLVYIKGKLYKYSLIGCNLLRTTSNDANDNSNDVKRALYTIPSSWLTE